MSRTRSVTSKVISSPVLNIFQAARERRAARVLEKRSGIIAVENEAAVQE